MGIGRRGVLLSGLAFMAAACARATPRPAVPAPSLPADFDRWNQEAQTILSEGLETLRTFDVFQAFRVSSATESRMRLAFELASDPPTGADWDNATHVAHGLRGRADQLFQAVTTARLDTDVWRDQRRLADATHDLVELGDALGAYRDRLDALPPGDAAMALGLLDRAWAQWDTAAARWAITRAELVSCAS